MLILALVTGLMAVGRFFAGTSCRRALGQTGVLLMGAIFAAIGIYLFSTVTGPTAYLAADIVRDRHLLFLAGNGRRSGTESTA